MKRLFLIAAVALSPFWLWAQTAEAPRTAHEPDTVLLSQSDLTGLAAQLKISVGTRTASALNAAGYKLYEAKDYENAIPFFRAAAATDPRMTVAHFNLACVLSLSGRGLSGAGLEELLYHLHRSIELDPSRLDKLQSDSDLTEARKVDAVRNLAAIYGKGARWEWQGTKLFRTVGDKRFFVTDVPKISTRFSTGEQEFRIDGKGRYLAFVNQSSDGYQMYIVTPGGRIQAAGPAGPDEFPLLYSGFNIVFDPEGLRAAFAAEQGMWLWDVRDSRAIPVTAPENGDWDLPIEWVDSKLRFKRGNTFEFSFSGVEWQWNPLTSKSAKVPGGRAWNGESLN